MSRGRIVGIIFLVLVVISLAGYLFYSNTGGNGLTRVVRHYFFRDIPDKKYSWLDFTDRGAREGISGFYAYGNENGFSMWTLSGLKTFTHVPSTSVYMHEDICGAVRQLAANPPSNGSAVQASKEVTGNIEFWQTLIKPENLVTVLRLDEPEYKNGIDKVWSYSGIYKELNKLDRDSCN